LVDVHASRGRDWKYVCGRIRGGAGSRSSALILLELSFHSPFTSLMMVVPVSSEVVVEVNGLEPRVPRFSFLRERL
jgi:hypothetical protein